MVIVLLVVIVCVVISKISEETALPTIGSFSCYYNSQYYIASIAAAKKEVVNENSFDNPTYGGLKVNNSTLSRLPKHDHNCMFQVPHSYM